MKKSILLLMQLLPFYLLAADMDPAKVIQEHIKKPDMIMEWLQLFDHDTLYRYRSGNCDNLLHVTIKTVLLEENNYEQLQEAIQPVCTYLYKEIGIPINDVNCDGMTPLDLLHADLDHANNEPLENFLIDTFGAYGTYAVHWSLTSEIRSAMWETINVMYHMVFCCTKRKQS